MTRPTARFKGSVGVVFRWGETIQIGGFSFGFPEEEKMARLQGRVAPPKKIKKRPVSKGELLKKPGGVRCVFFLFEPSPAAVRPQVVGFVNPDGSMAVVVLNQAR